MAERGRRKGIVPGVEGLEGKLLLSGDPVPGPSAVVNGGPGEVSQERPNAVVDPAPVSGEVTGEPLMYMTGTPRGNAPNERGQTAVFQGRVSGSYRIMLASTPGVMSLRGNGSIRGMGAVEARAALPVSETAQDSVDLLIRNRKGTVVVRISGESMQSEGGNGPARGQYTIQSGTGAYAGATGSGVVTVRMLPNFRMLGTTGRFAFQFQPSAPRA